MIVEEKENSNNSYNSYEILSDYNEEDEETLYCSEIQMTHNVSKEKNKKL